MRISPISNNQYQPSHKAVNQKYLKMAIEETKRWKNPCLGSIVTSINIDFLFKQMSLQDVIDTLEAIEPYDNDKKAIKKEIDQFKSWKANQ